MTNAVTWKLSVCFKTSSLLDSIWLTLLPLSNHLREAEFSHINGISMKTRYLADRFFAIILRQWQPNAEGSTLSRGGIYLNPATMIAYDPICNR